MTTLPDLIARVSGPEQTVGESARLAGKSEVEEFERMKDAYDPLEPGSEERMISAYLRFRILGYEAYFRGEVDVPPLVAARPRLASMWRLGYDIAECDAVNRLCKCDCDKSYVWGRGYGTCPRIPRSHQNT
jgi:hypothetical protein